jgi:hypothetical protein
MYYLKTPRFNPRHHMDIYMLYTKSITELVTQKSWFQRRHVRRHRPWSVGCWDCRFKSCLRHGYLSSSIHHHSLPIIDAVQSSYWESIVKIKNARSKHFMWLTSCLWSLGSSVGIVCDYRLDERSSIPGGAKAFSSSLFIQTGSEAHPAS